MLIWKAHSRPLDALAFSPDGRALAVAGHYLAARVFDAATGERRWTADGASSFARSLAFTPGGAVACRRNGLSLRDPHTGDELLKLGDWCQSFAVSPDGRTAFTSGGRPDRVRRYDLRSGAVVGEADADAGAASRLAVSPDGALVAAVGCARFCLLTGDELRPVASAAYRELSSGAFALTFSPCGRRAVYSVGANLIAWDVRAGREAARRELEAKHVLDAAFTPDGRRLLTVGREGAVRVWDTAGWACVRAFEWGVGPLRAVAVSPDGTRAAAVGDTGQVVIWDLDG